VNSPKRVKKDYKTPVAPARPPLHKPHWRLRFLALTLGLVILGVVMAKTQDEAPAAARAAPAAERDAVQRQTLPLPSVGADGAADAGGAGAEDAGGTNASDSLRWRTLTVESGDTLAALLADADIPSRTVHELATAGKHGRSLARLHPGEQIRIGLTADGRLQRLEHAQSPARRLVFDREGDGFEGAMVHTPLERRLEHARGTIRTSLFQAGAEAGLGNRLIMDLVGIFGWDIDFVLDIRRGDRFTLVHEAFYKNGQHVRDGAIVAAEFVNDGRRYRAVRYTDAEGETDYFAPDGTSMRKAFLRTPVKFTRITSGFGKRRHPILGTMRNHHGVDYAAPMGTPIRSTGDGVIVHRGRNGGYGNFVVVRHGNRYSTAYGHLARFKGGQAVGSRVEQGDVIGYVGSTGLSTGPHLHYEFRVNGVHKNPLKVEFPSVEPIPDDELDRFRQAVSPRLAQLEALDRAFASLEP
jgi:murein DD-endopeptidase MepM/ murein hydrolase activator NlpD